MNVERVRKTFDDDYGKHALIMPGHTITPLCGRIDVLEVLEKNGGARLHPSRVAAGYIPTHSKRSWLR